MKKRIFFSTKWFQRWLKVAPSFFKKKRALPAPGKTTYIMSSLFLSCSHEYLDHSEDESLFYASGFEIDRNTFVIDRLVQVNMAVQNRCYVSAETGSSHQALVKMENYGQRLFGLFHIHPGSGKSAASPSGLDLMTMDKYETAGYPTVGAVFSRDGWVRFFSANNKKYKVNVIGTGVEQHGDKTFKLTEVNHI